MRSLSERRLAKAEPPSPPHLTAVAPLCSPPEVSRAGLRLCTKWHTKVFALPLNVRILHFWRIASGGGISMTPARRNCRARSRTRIGYSTPFIDSSFPVGIEPFEWGAELRRGDWGVGCCGGDSDVLERSRARRPPLGSAVESPERETPLPPLIMQDARIFLASR